MIGPRTRTTRLRMWLVGLTCALVVVAAGCGSRPVPQSGGSTSSKADKARKDAEALAVSAVTGAASAQANAVPEAAVRRDKDIPLNVVVASKTDATAPPPAPPTIPNAPVPATPTPSPPATVVSAAPGAGATSAAPKPATRPVATAVIRERVVSVPAPEPEAEENALNRARDLIERKLAELDPPVRYRPSASEVKAEFVRKDSRQQRPFKPTPEQKELYDEAAKKLVASFVLVEYEVEVTAEQVRELRSQERSWAALRVLGILVAVALAGFLFLRADEWTKGYLTSWLALAAAVLAGGAAAAFIFI